MVKALSVMGLVLALAPSAFGTAAHTEIARLRVSDHVVHWHSAGAGRKMLDLHVTVNGHEVAYEQVRNCIAYAGGRGVSVRMESCGPRAQTLRVSAIALHPAKLVISYRYR